MGDKSGIEWTDATWNPVTGCTKVSPGCTNCYIERTPPFRKDGRKFEYANKAVTTGVRLHPERLEQPLRWRKPRRIFVNSMSDLFHEDVPWEFIARVFGVMARASQHIFQVLTKRPDRMRWLLTSPAFVNDVACHAPEVLDGTLMPWPLPNVWLGVSVENQLWADRRIPLLLQTPAAVRFISAEPLLGPVELVNGSYCYLTFGGHPWGTLHNQAKVDWVIAGGESGPRARPMHPDWVRSLRDQCQAAGAPFFLKQNGEYAPLSALGAGSWGRETKKGGIIKDPDGQPMFGGRIIEPRHAGRDVVYRVGKRAAGALLNGREWREFPEVAA